MTQVTVDPLMVPLRSTPVDGLVVPMATHTLVKGHCTWVSAVDGTVDVVHDVGEVALVVTTAPVETPLVTE